MDRYPEFFEELFGNEGNFQRDPNDKGNYYKGILYGTIFGITARDHFEAFKKAKELYDLGKYEMAKNFAMRFYRSRGYWNDLYNKIHDSSLAFKIFDFGVNAGVGTAVKLIQRVIAVHWGYKIRVDGGCGEITVAAINKATYSTPLYPVKVKAIQGESILYAYYIDFLGAYYRGLGNFWRFGKGWLRRLGKVFNKVPDLYYKVLKGKERGVEY